jgi:hypothetical protein
MTDFDHPEIVTRSSGRHRLIHLLGYPALFAYLTFGISAAFLLVRLGHSVLGLLRDLDDYRAQRPSRLPRSNSPANRDETSEPRVTAVRR